MSKNLLDVRKVSKPLRVICLVLAMLITLQTVRIPTKAADQSGTGSYAKFLKEINVDNAKVNDSTKWSNLVDSKKVDEIKRSYNSYSEENPLMINSAAELAAFAAVVNSSTEEEKWDFEGKYVKMGCDIHLEGSGLDCNDSVETDDKGNKVFTLTYSGTVEKAWNPIGISEDKAFKGTLDGGSHEIKNMVVLEKSNNNDVYAGLFGCVGDGATIKNIEINQSSYVVGSLCVECSKNTYAGGIIGKAFGSITITGIHVLGTVSSSSNCHSSKAYAGGIAGDFNGTITDSYATGAVSSIFSCSSSEGSYTGGLVGSSNGTIINSYATGAVSSSSFSSTIGKVYIGGLAGFFDGIITNS